MIAVLGASTISMARSTYGLVAFCLRVGATFVFQLSRLRFRFRQTVEQLYYIGVQSVPVIAFCLAFVSLILILEFSFHMKLVLRQDSLVPAFSTVLILRELGPVVACLLLVSRAGAGIAAELGTMKVTEQMDALSLLSIDPIDFLVVPRWIASVIASVSLSLIAVGSAIAGGALLASAQLGYSPAQFVNTMFAFARYEDVVGCVAKAFLFGCIFPLVASYHGFQCKPGSSGVGDASTAAVVQGSILIICADFFVTYLLYAV